MQVLGAPETRLQEVDMVLGGENDNGLKNHLHKKFKPPEQGLVREDELEEPCRERVVHLRARFGQRQP